MLAKGNLAKMMIWGRKDLKDKIIKMEKYELLERVRQPRGRRLVQNEAWRRVRKDIGIIKRHKGFDIYKEEYGTLTERIRTDTTIGEERRKERINDGEMTKYYKCMNWKRIRGRGQRYSLRMDLRITKISQQEQLWCKKEKRRAFV